MQTCASACCLSIVSETSDSCSHASFSSCKTFSFCSPICCARFLAASCPRNLAEWFCSSQTSARASEARAVAAFTAAVACEASAAISAAASRSAAARRCCRRPSCSLTASCFCTSAAKRLSNAARSSCTSLCSAMNASMSTCRRAKLTSPNSTSASLRSSSWMSDSACCPITSFVAKPCPHSDALRSFSRSAGSPGPCACEDNRLDFSSTSSCRKASHCSVRTAVCPADSSATIKRCSKHTARASALDLRDASSKNCSSKASCAFLSFVAKRSICFSPISKRP
mmetsp:Transcript_106774/g.194224  ORF Transcript_106774/g.194224 Transcript_106774/m.194224 type:complete len:283 (+) Transcript_106774:657-1505(+)